ncbi:hypothetical protein [Bartonella sp. DGB1]|uniref:hypothetical protein n=1 Tax=Bartonella sp. DGB1 TaxID=3239807 RepID=UPI00352348CD
MYQILCHINNWLGLLLVVSFFVINLIKQAPAMVNKKKPDIFFSIKAKHLIIAFVIFAWGSAISNIGPHMLNYYGITLYSQAIFSQIVNILTLIILTWYLLIKVKGSVIEQK